MEDPAGRQHHCPSKHLLSCVTSAALHDKLLLCVPTRSCPLLRERWRTILAGACFQYVHGMATQLAHRMHRPLVQPLHDVGFDLLPVR